MDENNQSPAPVSHVLVPAQIPDGGLTKLQINNELAAYACENLVGGYGLIEGFWKCALEFFGTPAPVSHLVGVDILRLPIGTPVEKVGGYPFPGTVVAAFHTLYGQERFVVEATGAEYAGMLHIFNGGQLRALTAEGPTDA